MPEDDANVGMLPMVATQERREIMASYFTLTLRAQETIAPAKVEAFAAVAISLGLHPLAGELMIIEGRLYVTIDGRRRLAMRNPDFAAIQPSMVTDEPTRIAMGATRKGDVLAMCKLWRKSTPMPSIQYGLVREAERWPSKDKRITPRGQDPYTIYGEQTKLGLSDDEVEAARAMHDPDSLFDLASDPAAKVRPVLTQPAMMAMKRAEARALSLMASVALPTYDPEVGAPLDPDIGPNGDSPIFEGSLVEPEPPAAPEYPVEPVAEGVAEPPADNGLVQPDAPAEPESADEANGGEPVEPESAPAVPFENSERTCPKCGAEMDFESGDTPVCINCENAKQGGEPEPAPAEPVPDPMTRATPPTPAPGRHQRREPVGGGLVRAPDTREGVIRHAVEHLHYKNIAAVLAALGIKDATEIKDCATSWATLVKLAPAETPA